MGQYLADLHFDIWNYNLPRYPSERALDPEEVEKRH